MPGIRFVSQVEGLGTPIVRYRTPGASLSFRGGDLVVLSTLNALAGGNPALRLLATADGTALYQTAANDTVGIFALNTNPAVINASNFSTGEPAAVTVAANVQPFFRIPSYSNSIPGQSDGKGMQPVVVIDDETILGGTLLETTTITEALIETFVGLDMTVTSGVTAYKWSTAAAVKVGKIVGVNMQDTKFNVSGGGGEIFVRILPAFCQYRNGFNYAT